MFASFQEDLEEEFEIGRLKLRLLLPFGTNQMNIVAPGHVFAHGEQTLLFDAAREDLRFLELLKRMKLS